MAINPISKGNGINLITGINKFTFNQIADIEKKQDDGIPFSSFLTESIKNTNNILLEADRISDDFAAGLNDNLHEVTIATAKADLALQYTIQVRTKIMDAYNEIMRMQI
jgi:flagellar hook-basal body complex protein FliE